MTTQRAGELVSENMRTLYLWSLHKTSDPYKAEDLCSDIILAVLKSAPNLKCDDAFFGFVWKVAANTYKQYLRKISKSETAELDEETADQADFEDDLEEKERENILRRELAFLSEKYRICTVAYYYERMSIKDIAEKFGLTTQTVKFNLFQSRKILKEGIAMERQFGEKSFNPQPFQFRYIFNGDYNNAFDNLVSRKLPGQILLSAYYEPMTVEQLSVELGIASVYLEDELDTLLRYNFIKQQGKKYQTCIPIFTKDYNEDILNALNEKYPNRVKAFVDAAREKLPEIRKIGFDGADKFSDNILLWDIFAYAVMSGTQQTDGGAKFRPMYRVGGKDVTGICYGIEDKNLESSRDYGTMSYAGLGTIADNEATWILFWAAYDRERFVNGFDFGREEPNIKGNYPIFTEEQRNQLLYGILGEEFNALKEMMTEIGKLATEMLKDRSPDCAAEVIDYHCPHIVMWNLMGWYGGAAVKTGALEPAGEDEYPGFLGFKD